MAGVTNFYYQEAPVARYICARLGLGALAALTIFLLALTVFPAAP